MEFTKQDWALVNDLINVAWQRGAVTSPQMGGAIEQLRAKVQAKIDPQKQDEAKAAEKLKKVQ